MPRRTTRGKAEVNRAAIYARVSDKSQDTEDKASISEQIGDMEAYCESKGLTITARYQEVGRGWSKSALSSKGCWPMPKKTLRHHRVLEVRPPEQGDVPRRRPHGGRRGPPDSP